MTVASSAWPVSMITGRSCMPDRSQHRSDRSPHEWFVVHNENLDPIKVGHATVSGSELKPLIPNRASRHAAMPDGPLKSNRERFIPYS